MGRTRALADADTKALAQWLLSLHQGQSCSFSQLALKTEALGVPISSSTLWRATQGKSTPTWRVVDAFTRACGGDLRDLHDARDLWIRAAGTKNNQSRLPIPAPGRPLPALPYIVEPVDLLTAMNQLRLKAGNPSLRALEQQATAGGGVSYLPHSTLGAVLNGTRPCPRKILLEFVRACGVTSDKKVRQWAEAWDRVEQYQHEGGGSALADLQQRVAALEEKQQNEAPAPTAVPSPRRILELVPAQRPELPTTEKEEEHAPVSRLMQQWLPRLVRIASAIQI